MTENPARGKGIYKTYKMILRSTYLLIFFEFVCHIFTIPISPLLNVILHVLEVALHFLSHPDHNVIAHSLELLQQIFKSRLPHLFYALLQPGGVQRSSLDSFRGDATTSIMMTMLTPAMSSSSGHSRNGSTGGISLTVCYKALFEEFIACGDSGREKTGRRV